MSAINKFIKQHPNLFASLKLIFFLYIFFFSLDLMGSSVKLFGEGFAETIIASTSNPLVGLFIGILATSIIQSSSSTTSIVVGMVAGGVLDINGAIPIIMGANIGTSITNTIAALPQINRSVEFKRAFAAATVHDFFNFLSVLIIYPLQVTTNFLGIISEKLEIAFTGVGGLNILSPVKAITKPIVHFFTNNLGDYPWLLLVLALVVLFIALKFMVGSLKLMVVAKAQNWFDKYLFKNALRAFFVGVFLTVLVQSSSITTSLMVPLAGAGILTLKKIFPYTLGANIGTTVTALLAALITGSQAAVTVAFSHLLFNISGIVIWAPFSKVPIYLAEKFAELSIKNKMIPVAYILIMFFVIPISVIFIFN